MDASDFRANAQRREQQPPPDLEQAMRKLFRKLKQNPDGNTPLGSMDEDHPPSAMGLAWVILLFMLALWVVSGFFIVSPAERAVITRFGKYVRTEEPGLHWIPPVVSAKRSVNIQAISNFHYEGQMLTKDESIASVGIAVQYRITDPEAYLFNVTNPIESLRQATASVLRQEVGNRPLAAILTYGNEAAIAGQPVVRIDNKVESQIKQIMSDYKTGLMVTDVTVQYVKPPEEVVAAFDDAIKASEDEVRYEKQARAQEKGLVNQARGYAKRLMQEARADKQTMIADSKAATASYLAILPQYQAAPKVTRERLYLQAIRAILGHSSKLLVDVKGGNNVMFLPLNELQSNHALPELNNIKVARPIPSEIQAALTARRRLNERPSRESRTRATSRGEN